MLKGKLANIGITGLVFTEGLVQHTPRMFIGWLTCISAVLLLPTAGKNRQCPYPRSLNRKIEEKTDAQKRKEEN